MVYVAAIEAKIEAKSLYDEPHDIQPLNIFKDLMSACHILQYASDSITWCAED